MNQNRVIALILLAFVIWWGYLTTNLPETTMPAEPGPKFFPYVILGLMAITSAFLFFAKPKKESTDEVQSDDVEDQDKETTEQFPMLDVLKLFAIFLGGIMLVRYIGFNLGMIISISLMLWSIGWKLFPRAILFSSVVTLTIYFLFSWFLGIPLPTGALF